MVHGREEQSGKPTRHATCGGGWWCAGTTSRLQKKGSYRFTQNAIVAAKRPSWTDSRVWPARVTPSSPIELIWLCIQLVVLGEMALAAPACERSGTYPPRPPPRGAGLKGRLPRAVSIPECTFV